MVLYRSWFNTNLVVQSIQEETEITLQIGYVK